MNLKLKKWRVIASFGITLFAGLAKADSVAGIFIEPGVTLQKSELKTNFPSPFTSSSGDSNGLGLVGRAGIHLGEVLFLAADARYAQQRYSDSSNNLQANAEAYQIGPVAGMQTPLIGLRLWAGYILAAQLNPGESNGVDFKFKDGKGYLVGAGFHILMISLNVEYQDLTYNSVELEKLGPFSVNSNFGGTTLADKSWILSVTFPFEL